MLHSTQADSDSDILWQIDEIIRCKEDPLYFFLTYVKILSSDGSTSHPLVTPRLLSTFNAYNESNKLYVAQPTRIAGTTTMWCALMLWHVLFDADNVRDISYFSHNRTASRLASDRFISLYHMLPAWMQLCRFNQLTQTAMQTSFGTVIKFRPVSVTGWCADRNDLIIFDNACAYISDLTDTHLHYALSCQPTKVVVNNHLDRMFPPPTPSIPEAFHTWTHSII